MTGVAGPSTSTWADDTSLRASLAAVRSWSSAKKTQKTLERDGGRLLKLPTSRSWSLRIPEVSIGSGWFWFRVVRIGWFLIPCFWMFPVDFRGIGEPPFAFRSVAAPPFRSVPATVQRVCPKRELDRGKRWAPVTKVVPKFLISWCKWGLW